MVAGKTCKVVLKELFSSMENMSINDREMRVASTGIVTSTIISVDGLMMASALPADVGKKCISATSAVMLSLVERIAGELGRSSFDHVYIRGKMAS